MHSKQPCQSPVSLSDGEWKLMNRLWRNPPHTITHLVASLKEETGWSKHTVITMLSRMEAKGAVYFEEGERAKQYYPSIKKEQTAVRETENFLQKVYGGSLGLMVNALVQTQSLSKKEIDELNDILKKAEEEQAK